MGRRRREKSGRRNKGHDVSRLARDKKPVRGGHSLYRDRSRTMPSRSSGDTRSVEIDCCALHQINEERDREFRTLLQWRTHISY
jgi:hypothetical protein